MFRSLLFILLVSKSHSYVFKPGPLFHATKGEVWPKPQHVDKLDDGYYSLLPSFFQFNTIGATCNTLNEALDRYKQLILFNNRKIKQVYYKARTCYEGSDNSSFIGFLTTLDVELIGSCNDDEYPSIEMKEEYVLNITQSVQKLSSGTIWGILRGLETFSQLIYLTDDFSCHRIETTSIHDYPRFAHRGLLLDTSRHYHAKDSILKMLDALSYNKFNVFHWHLTDDYSFPYVSETFPELSEKGAFHPTLMIYEQDFVQEVQEYARKRGIRVIVEFDTPGHTLSWGLGNPDLLTLCKNVLGLEWGPIDPTKNSTYEFMFKFLDEVTTVFQDKYIHLGGDEVAKACWESNEDVMNWMTENNINGTDALQTYYIQQLTDYISSKNLHSVVWEEVFTSGVNLNKSTIVQVWINEDGHNPKETLSKVTKAGHPAIISAFWYLDILTTGADWAKFWNADPHDFDGNDEQKNLVIGGEACMWSEVVDSNNLEPRVWPRASIAAEKFWSAPGEYFDSEAPDMIVTIEPIATRLQEHTCRMNRRGISAQPAAGPSVCF